MRRPQIKLPSLPKRSRGEGSSERASRPGRSVDLPEPLRNVWQDLRDRRLVPVVALVALALVAVPVLLSTSPSASPPPPVLAADEDSEKLQSAVVVDEQIGVRDYSKRLDDLKSRNPFRVSAEALEGVENKVLRELGIGDSGEAGDGAGAGADAGGAATGQMPQMTEVPPPVEPEQTRALPSAPAPSPAPSGGGPGNGGSTGGGAGSNGPRPSGPADPDEMILLAHHIDVRFGPKGEARKRKGVEPLDFLPARRQPVVLFLGASTNGKRALFLITGGVRSSRGDGRCSPETHCEILTLRPGERRFFEYGPNDTTYLLTLHRIFRTVVD